MVISLNVVFFWFVQIVKAHDSNLRIYATQQRLNLCWGLLFEVRLIIRMFNYYWCYLRPFSTLTYSFILLKFNALSFINDVYLFALLNMQTRFNWRSNDVRRIKFSFFFDKNTSTYINAICSIKRGVYS